MTYIDKEQYREELWRAFLPFKITRTEFNCLWDKVSCVHLKRGQAFIEEFKICKRLGYLISGEMCAHGIDVNGKKTTSQFFLRPDNRVVVSLRSFNLEEASVETIMALSACVLLFITFDDLKSVCLSHTCYDKIGRILGAKQLNILMLQIATLKQLSPKQQVALLFKEHPEFFVTPFKCKLISYTGIGKTNLNSIKTILGIKK